ncbi:MAG TPA: SseB family protein [Microbacterium sp.]|uniref:SseB family protein n=1 Tax=Microbacterium sp. TaxID=51671 RepID=UPI002B4928DF|nr:SseB family protein [Microbacterium sp.]HKT55171.1 SseB family protein [Microbacterium sp.]
MALFSKRSSAPEDPRDAKADEVEPQVDAPAPAEPEASEPAPQVGISLSSFDGFGAAAPTPSAGDPHGDDEPEPTLAAAPVPDGAPPAPRETIPGLQDNVLLEDALAALGEDPQAHELIGVARQLFQGLVYLRVQGNAEEVMARGDNLPLAIAHRDDGEFLLVFSGGKGIATAVQQDGEQESSALGQTGPAVLEYVLSGTFAGIILDHGSAPASVVLPRTLIEQAFTERDPEGTIKALLSSPRTAEVRAQVAQALATSPVWVAANRESEDAEWGIAQSHSPSGERILELFTHPLEVVAVGRGDQPAQIGGAQLADILAGDAELAGVVIDPAGPWMLLSRAEISPLLALAGTSNE